MWLVVGMSGDPLIMEATVKMCKEKDVAVGAHPGYPDLMGFGRRKMAVSPDEARAYMVYQLGALQAFLPSIRCRVAAHEITWCFLQYGVRNAGTC